MKHYIFLLLTLFLAACAEKDLSGDGRPVGPQTGLRLSARLGQGTLTRAVGDPFTSGLEEKRIDRLAFFVHTAEDGFQVYPPVPDDVTDPDAAAKDYPNKVYLTGTPADGYTATVSLTAGGGYVADIIAIANLPKDYDYRQIVSWQGLQDTVAILATAMPACLPGSAESDKAKRNAFVMYADIRHELKKEETNDLTFALSRLVARIDITNEAYEKGTTPSKQPDANSTGFLLTSAQLLRVKPAAYLVPKADLTPDVATTSWPAITTLGDAVGNILYGKPSAKSAADNPTGEPDQVQTANVATSELQYLWHTLYTYPNNDTEHAPTTLEVKGTFRGNEITRQIPFVDKDGKPFPVEGNHRYLVRIQRAPGQTDITFDIKVSEWDAVDTVHVKPDQTEVPVITELDGNGVYVEKTKRYDVYYSADGEITFDAACTFAPDVRVRYEEPGQADWITIERSEPELVTKATKLYKRHFKITIPKTTDKVNRKAMLLIHNGGSEVECDTINVRQTYFYPGTELVPVALGETNGKDIIWAPVNVGAVRLPTKDNATKDNALNSEELQSQIEEAGYCFQWGRRLGIQPTLKTPFSKGPISKEELLSKHEMKNEFVAVQMGTIDWITPSDNELWRGDGIKGIYDPCPEGWRVPNKNELQVLEDKIVKDGVYDKDKNVFNISGSQLVLPITGYYYYVDYVYMSCADNECVFLWSSTATSDIQSYYLRCKYTKVNTSTEVYKACACPVRCIQE